MSAPTVAVDVTRLYRALTFITLNPHRWDQTSWFVEDGSRTIACLAGTVALLAGYRPTLVIWDGRRRTSAHVRRYDVDRSEHVRDVAQRLLHLTRTQGDALFSPLNTLLDLWLVGRALSAGTIEVPVDVRAEVERTARRGTYHDARGRPTRRP